MFNLNDKETYRMEVVSSSVYYPEKSVKTGDYIRERAYIEERVVASPEETHFFMAGKTLEDMLSTTDVNPSDVSLIVAQNTNVQGHIPCKAAKRHKVVSARNEPAMDILYDGSPDSLLSDLRKSFDGYVEHNAKGVWEKSFSPDVQEDRLGAVVYFEKGSLASQLAKEFGMDESSSFDVITGCASLNAGLQLACGFNKNAQKYFAVVGVDRMNDFVDLSDESTNDLFGDLASGFLLKPSYKGFLSHSLNTQIDCKEVIKTEIKDGREVFVQKGLRVYKWAVPKALEMIDQALDIHSRYRDWRRIELTSTKQEEPEGSFYVCMHQANPRMIQEIASKAPETIDGFVLCGTKTGNCSTASIGQSFHNLRTKSFYKKNNILRLSGEGEQVSLEPYDYVLVLGFGAGLTYGWNLMRNLP